jgi:hypothetical protein
MGDGFALAVSAAVSAIMDKDPDPDNGRKTGLRGWESRSSALQCRIRDSFSQASAQIGTPIVAAKRRSF